MVKGIVRLEDMLSAILESEVPTEIIVTNPGDRTVVITPEESGWGKKQVFTSDCLPDKIEYKLLGIVRFPDGSCYLKYLAKVVTSQELCLKGKEGAEKGVEVINKIAFGLTWQKGMMLVAESVKEPDLRFFDYKKEELSYWLASTGVVIDDYCCYFGPRAVNSGSVGADYDLFDSDGESNEYWLGVRPVMILSSKIKKRFPLVEL